ncbi:MAG: ABC transporter permease [Alphaproteobacteria bacterium]|nr:ABC transporter permease [Alphaproteobacteria bacterium]
MQTCMRSLLTLPLTLLALLACTFAFTKIAPIDPVLAVVGDRASEAARIQARKDLGLDRPWPIQFLWHVERTVTGDLGLSTSTGHAVLDDLAQVFPATIELALAATLIGLVLGLPLGIIGAYWRGSWPDHLARLIALLGHSVPVFWLGLMALYLFYALLGWAPGPGRLNFYLEGLVPTVSGFILLDSLLAGRLDVAGDALAHLVLPALTLGLFSTALFARTSRALMLDALGQDFILTARAKGLSEWNVVLGHALKSCAAPMVTTLALALGSLLEGSVLTETVFSWPGLGAYMTGALMAADMAAILGGTLLIGLVVSLLNLGADFLQRKLDPRTAS